MVLIKIPFRLRWVIYSLILSIPLIAVEIALVSRAPIWDLPWQRMGYGAFAFALVSIPLVAWLLSLHRWAWHLALCLGAIWVFFSFVLSIRMGFPNLTFFSVFLSLLLIGQFYLISREMNQSFLYPRVSWFQGRPELVPHLIGEVKLMDGAESFQVRVSRFDSQGVFIFPVAPVTQVQERIQSLMQCSHCELVLQFRQLCFQGTAQPIVFLSRGLGVGLQWKFMDFDLKKELEDFQEGLRGEGYV